MSTFCSICGLDMVSLAHKCSDNRIGNIQKQYEKESRRIENDDDLENDDRTFDDKLSEASKILNLEE